LFCVLSVLTCRAPRSPLFPYTTLFRSVGVIAVTLIVGCRPCSAQLVVFDPNNYAQNVLTAARTLQQVNNQIVSLQNQAQMLINQDRKSTRLNSSHVKISYAVFCLKKKK